MNSLITLSQTKNNLIKALRAIPPKTVQLLDENQSSFESVDLIPAVEEDIEQLNNFWEFLENYYHLKVIALVGMVNAGKSALGNYLLQREESEVFQEAPIRETSDAQEAKLDENTVIFDLPGLGSVLSDEDDEVVKGILNRANLLLIVLDCNYPIPKHLYEFLKSDQVIKNEALQKIIIVINKIDCLSDLPDHIQQKQIKKYINFLYFGNKQMNFSGIDNLFDYEIPVVAFSVFQARRRDNYFQEKQLRQEINKALSSNSNDMLYRAGYQLYQLVGKYSPLATNYAVLREKQNYSYQEIETVLNSMNEGMQRLVGQEVENLASRIRRIRERCFNELNTYATTSAERFWQGEHFQRKKNSSSSCKDRYKKEISNEFINFTRNLQSSISFIAQNLLGRSFIISLPESKSIISALENSIYEIWDAFDDYFFLDKERNTFDHSLNQSDQEMNKASDEISNWISEFVQDFSNTLEVKCQELTLFQEYGFFKEQADSLEQFFEEFMSIDLVQSIFFNRSDSSH
ncbi:MAG: GTP-binding protein [Symploca sp. SIO2B6]|nr:GTP-binding protein [Symploca sp. SIO2B6]